MPLEFSVDLINEYLVDNGKEPNKGYLTRDNGQGNFIAEWDVEGLAEPSLQKLQPYVNVLATKEAQKLRDTNRRNEYPLIVDQIEAIIKQYKLEQDGGATLHPDLQTVIADIDAVKAKYP